MDLLTAVSIALFFVFGIPWLEDYIIAERCPA
jgi:hypothetical protein